MVVVCFLTAFFTLYTASGQTSVEGESRSKDTVEKFDEMFPQHLNTANEPLNKDSHRVILPEPNNRGKKRVVCVALCFFTGK